MRPGFKAATFRFPNLQKWEIRESLLIWPLRLVVHVQVIDICGLLRRPTVQKVQHNKAIGNAEWSGCAGAGCTSLIMFPSVAGSL